MNKGKYLFFVLLAGLYFFINTRGVAQYSEAIEDNSYFIEEAYNQEFRVVQHISNGLYTTKPTKDFIYTFTQEWPVISQKHQFSFTLPFLSIDSYAQKGLGDIFLNYRYQLTEHDDFVTMAPRLSVILPTGKKDDGLGEGITGLQFNIPVSKRLSESFASHFNIGATVFPEKKFEFINSEFTKLQVDYFVGLSTIFLAHENFNLMLECVLNLNSQFGEDKTVTYTGESIISPGLRYAINIGELQIVPGFAMPVYFPNASEVKPSVGYFFYLSFEHPY